MTVKEKEQKLLDFITNYRPADGTDWISEEELRRVLTEYAKSL